jgi:hypothetical protein
MSEATSKRSGGMTDKDIGKFIERLIGKTAGKRQEKSFNREPHFDRSS